MITNFISYLFSGMLITRIFLLFALVFFLLILRNFFWWEKNLRYEFKYFFVLTILLWISFIGYELGIRELLTVFLFGVIGMIVETLGSIYWKWFFPNRFYYYILDGWFKSYTSWLNIIPWAIGARLYLTVARNVFENWYSSGDFFQISFYIVLISLVAAVTVCFFYKWLIGMDKKMSMGKLIIVISPFLLSILVNIYLFGFGVLWIVIAFGVIGSLAEYLYGKFIKLVLGKKLWKYQYFTLDDGHFSLLNPIPFSVLGFVFGLAAYLVQLLLAQ